MSSEKKIIDDLLELYILSNSEKDLLRYELDRNNAIMAIRMLLWLRDFKNIFKKKLKDVLKPPPKVRYDESDEITFLSEKNKQRTIVPENIYVHIHAFYLEYLQEIIDYLNNISFDYDCYITTDSENKKRVIQYYAEKYLYAKNKYIIATPNRGRDIGPWLVECKEINRKYQLACHVHTKKSIHLPAMGNRWRRYLMDNLLGSPSYVESIVSLFKEEQRLGLVFPPFYSEVASSKKWKGNKLSVLELLKRCGVNLKLPPKPDFSAGTMLWYRPEALAPLFDADMKYSDFEDEKGQLEGTLMHAVERSLVYIAQSHGYKIKKILAESERERKSIYS